MEIIYNILIPIISSLIGGIVGGLFTYLGVKLTINNDNKLYRQETCEKNKEKNKLIANDGPNLTKTTNESFFKETEIYLIPYISPTLTDEQTIKFDYEDIFNEQKLWNSFNIQIKNIGKTTIKESFLQLNYKCFVNIYTKSDFKLWESAPWLKNQYSDTVYIENHITPNETISLKIYYPKQFPKLKDTILNVYMLDKNDNCWFQRNINIETFNSIPDAISLNEYIMHSNQDCNFWFIYDHLFHNKNIKKDFNYSLKFLKELQKRKERCWKEEKENREFKRKVQNGEIVLN